jgi:hypothetical protein
MISGFFCVFVLSIVTVGSPASAAIVRTEWQSNAAADDLITYSYNEDNGPHSVCSAGNTQNVNVAGAEIITAGISAIKIQPGGSCYFWIFPDQDQGTYHYYFRIRAESGDPAAPVGQAHLTISANYDQNNPVQPWNALADTNTLVTFPHASSFSILYGTDDGLWATVDWASRSGIAYRDFSSNGITSLLLFGNVGPETVYLDASFLSSAQ